MAQILSVLTALLLAIPLCALTHAVDGESAYSLSNDEVEDLFPNVGASVTSRVGRRGGGVVLSTSGSFTMSANRAGNDESEEE